MPKLNAVLRAAPAAAAILALASACDQAKPRQPNGAAPGPVSGAQAPAGAAAPAAPGAANVTTDPLVPTPAWAQAYLGKTLAGAFPDQNGVCIGNTDDVEKRFQGSTPGVLVEGWGWDPTAKKPVEHILLTDNNGAIVGAGQTGKARPDVNKAKPEITSPTTGWEGPATVISGGVNAYGITGGGKSVCKLGHLNL